MPHPYRLLALLGGLLLAACTPAVPAATPSVSTPTPATLATATPIATSTITPSPRATVGRLPALDLTVQVSPQKPVVGQGVVITVTAQGDGGLPQYRLTLDPDPGPLRLDSERAFSYNRFETPAVWKLTAVQPGQAAFTVFVNWETQGVDGQGNTFWYFTTMASDRYTVTVAQP